MPRSRFREQARLPGEEPRETEADDELGWARAILTGGLILLAGFAGAVLGPNAILTRAQGLGRAPREWLATALSVLALVALAAILRRLQARGLI